MVQWLRICLPVQGTWVRSLVGRDPICRAATKPMLEEPGSRNHGAHVPKARAPQHEKPLQ